MKPHWRRQHNPFQPMIKFARGMLLGAYPGGHESLPWRGHQSKGLTPSGSEHRGCPLCLHKSTGLASCGDGSKANSDFHCKPAHEPHFYILTSQQPSCRQVEKLRPEKWGDWPRITAGKWQGWSPHPGPASSQPLTIP